MKCLKSVSGALVSKTLIKTCILKNVIFLKYNNVVFLKIKIKVNIFVLILLNESC
jgi:hypothetical protein